jgi:type I restriction-modification system DNA methylase subunit
MGYQQAKENLAKLIAKFERELAAGKIKDYNEEAAKTVFIQPFLKDVLGWDVNDRDEVSPEEKTSRGRVDYGLKVEGKIKIFVEAKPPKAELSRHIDQAIRYGYNRKGVPFVLLTDFESIMLFDVTVKPDVRNPRKGLKIDLSWPQYLQEIEQLWLLSKESALQGKLDELLRVKPKERVPVDKAILEDLKEWREILAKDIYKNNPHLFHSEDREKDADYLKEITQKILDRIIFMRSCGDRGLIQRRSLKELFEERTDAVGTNTMVFLGEEFKHFNIIFDSDLFRPQDWETGLAIDFKIMKHIVLETYNPYQFDVIPLEVLGNIYEQYLGYTIRLTDQQVKYEIKPEVRKAGGVYYTPEYIVDYIVKNTVGKLIEESSSKKLKRLRILDPACGSGSFLIRAYEEMLDYYSAEKKKKLKTEGKQKKLELGEEEELRLTIHEKSEILREHIFGVDIDEQAVEVTKLSLMLKMLEGEYGMVPGRAILPMLDKNIKCGNSLISGDTLELKKYFGDDWYKVKPFNWEDEFRTIMKDEGGFDAVVGNPPYGAFFAEEEKDFFRIKYQNQNYQLDSYLLILEKSLRDLLKNNSFYGMIIPNPWLTNLNQKKIRKFVVSKTQIREIVHFQFPIFPKATVDTEIVIIKKTKPKKNIASVKIVKSLETFQKQDNRPEIKILHKQSKWIKLNGGIINIFMNPSEEKMSKKCLKQSLPLSRLCTINVGIKPYQVGKGNPPQTEEIVERRPFDSDKPLDSSYRKYLRGSDINRYRISPLELRFIKYGPWLAEPRPAADFNSPIKIFMRQTGDGLIGAIDREYNLCLNNMHVIVPNKTTLSTHYLLGIINSRLLNWYYRTLNPEVGEALAEVKKTNVANLPIHVIDFSDSLENKLYNKLVFLVETMLDLNIKIQTAKGHEKEQIQRQIEKTDREIDELVYRLYGITDEERAIIEKQE